MRVVLLLLLAWIGCVLGAKFNFCINNLTPHTWTVANTLEIDNFDWENWKRPEQMLRQLIHGHNERCFPFHTNPNARSSPFKIGIHREGTSEWFAFRIRHYDEQHCSTPGNLEYSWTKPTVKVTFCKATIHMHPVTMPPTSAPLPPVCNFVASSCKREWKVVSDLDNRRHNVRASKSYKMSVGLSSGRTSSTSVEHWDRFKKGNTQESSIQGGYKSFIQLGFKASWNQEEGSDEKQKFSESQNWQETRAVENTYNVEVEAGDHVRTEQLTLVCDCFSYQTNSVRNIRVEDERSTPSLTSKPSIERPTRSTFELMSSHVVPASQCGFLLMNSLLLYRFFHAH